VGSRFEGKLHSAKSGQLELSLKNVLEQMCETTWQVTCSWPGAVEYPAGKDLASQSLSVVHN